MSLQEGVFPVRFLGSPELGVFLQELQEGGEIDFEVVEVSEKKGQTALRFGLATIADVLTLVQAAVLVGQFGVALYRWLRERNAKKIAVKSPTAVIEIQLHEGLTEAGFVTALEGLIPRAQQRTQDT